MQSTVNWQTTAHLYEEAASLVSANDYEKQLKDFSSGPPNLDWSVPEAFLAILLSAAHSDLNVTIEEQEQLKALRNRSRIMKGLSADQINRASLTASQKLQQRGDNGLRDACSCLPSILRMPVFALSVDLVLADGKLTQAERDFIAKIGAWLEIDTGVQLQVSQVMLIKNNC